MFWKIASVQTGQLLKAGFKNDEEARLWLEENRPGREDNYLVEEMDEDELEEWEARADEEAIEEVVEEDEEEDYEKGRYTYSTDDEDGPEDDTDLLSEVEEDE